MSLKICRNSLSFFEFSLYTILRYFCALLFFRVFRVNMRTVSLQIGRHCNGSKLEYSGAPETNQIAS